MSLATPDTAPAILFLILYSLYFSFLVYLYSTKKVKWASRYSFILFHVSLRLAGQACGIAFTVMNWGPQFDARVKVLIAYLVLSAEGYFSLVLCSFRFLVVWQELHLGHSNIEPHVPKGTPFWTKMAMIRKSKMGAIHWALIAANAIIVTGGSILSASLNKTGKVVSTTTGKALRTAGTAIFLALVQAYLYYGSLSYREYSRGEHSKIGRYSLLLILGTWPFLSIRGAFGIVQILDAQYSYYNLNVYTDTGIQTKFIVGEYVCTTTMEWISCGLLLSTYFLVGGEEVGEIEREMDGGKEKEKDKDREVELEGGERTLHGSGSPELEEGQKKEVEEV